MTFRERLREQIEYCGFLDKEVASRAGISKRTMDSYVGAEGCMPSAEVAVRIARVLGVSVEYLVTGEAAGGTAPAICPPADKNTRSLLHHFASLSSRDQILLVSLAEKMTKTPSPAPDAAR